MYFANHNHTHSLLYISTRLDKFLKKLMYGNYMIHRAPSSQQNAFLVIHRSFYNQTFAHCMLRTREEIKYLTMWNGINKLQMLHIRIY